MSYKIRISEHARTDMLEIFDYIAADDPNEAAKFLDNMEAEINDLVLFPYKFKEYDGKNKHFTNCRVLICYPYKIFYKIIDRIIYIVQIKHGARKE